LRQYETLRFVSDAAGQARNVQALNLLGGHGWRVVSETVEPGHMKGDQACCLAIICLPLGFAASRTPNMSVVSIECETDSDPGWAASPIDGHGHRMVTLDDNRTICELCGRPLRQGPVQTVERTRDPDMVIRALDPDRDMGSSKRCGRLDCKRKGNIFNYGESGWLHKGCAQDAGLI
jgi:hypothetical protein